jgi:hypothetical protein
VNLKFATQSLLGFVTEAFDRSQNLQQSKKSFAKLSANAGLFGHVNSSAESTIKPD